MSQIPFQDTLVQEFLAESRELLDAFERDLVALEAIPGDEKLLASAFRAIHTIKGTCSFLAFPRLEALTHAGEDLLASLRDGTLDLTAEITTTLLSMVDAIRTMLSCIESSRTDGEEDYAALRNELRRLGERRAAQAAAPALPRAVPAAASTAALAVAPAGAPANPTPAVAAAAGQAEAETSVRVDVALLDRLMNLVGELVLSRNQVLASSACREHRALLTVAQRLNTVTTELQDEVMKTRLQCLGDLWNKFHRLVRDLATACGKEVRVETQGGETELDRSIIETIRDPLIHLLRNAVDHGIEPPDSRRRHGKPARGRICLRAFHEDGQVNLEIEDDGAGVDLDRVRQKAVALGIMAEEEAARLPEREALGLLFLPGFSTAESVNRMSGRGVGLDVVKTNIENIGGSVDLQSRSGHGTRFGIKIPLTLAIVPALIVESDDQRYAIPQASISELVSSGRGRGRRGIEWFRGAPVYRLQGKLLPLLFLEDVLQGRRTASPSHAAGAKEAAGHIIILQSSGHLYGLVVDRILDAAEIVVKRPGRYLKGIPGFAGATILGDGKVVQILDVLYLAEKAGVRGREKKHRSVPAPAPSHGQATTRGRFLLVERSSGARLAFPLSVVYRLEEFPRSRFERATEADVIQYRGRILPVWHLEDLLRKRRGAAPPNGEEAPAVDPVPVVVLRHGGRLLGIAMPRIVDVVAARTSPRQGHQQGSSSPLLVLGGRVVEVLDVEAMLGAAGAVAEKQAVVSGVSDDA